MAAAIAEPRALICGRPLFDASIPRHRLYLRYLTHVMVWLNTLSFDIPDSMCGLRVYPLSIVLPAIVADPPGKRMDFDVEVLVRLHWAGVPMRWIPTRVRYALDGVSHFRLVRDNWLITVMHTKLFFGMLRRAPRLIARRLRAARVHGLEGGHVRAQGTLFADIDLDVSFHDVDMVGVVWHGHYLRYLEDARWALMNQLGYGLDRMIASGFAWPIVELQTKYVSPARFGDRLRVRASLVEWENRMAVNYLVSRPRRRRAHRASAHSSGRSGRQFRRVAVRDAAGLRRLRARGACPGERMSSGAIAGSCEIAVAQEGCIAARRDPAR